MSIKLLRKYIEYCTNNGIKPTFEGLKLWMESLEQLG